MQKSLFAIILLTTPLFAQAIFGQSGWTRLKGSFFGKIDISHLVATTYFSPTGTKLTTNAFNQSSINFYGEYGWKNRLTLIATAPLLRVNSFQSTEPVAGLGDLRVGLKYRLTQDHQIPLTISLAPEFPTGRRNAFSESKNVPGERINLPTGDGEFNIWTTLAASKSFRKTYVSGFTAYNFRTKYEGLPFRDLYQFGIEGGWNPVRRLWLNTKIQAQFATGESQHPELGFVRGDGATYTLASVEAFFKFNKNFGVTATYLNGGGWIAPLKNIYVAPYFALGVAYER